MFKNEFVNCVIDLLSPYGCIRAKAMFGGHAVYKDDVIVAIIINDDLYFKVDSESVHAYKLRGSKPFTYESRDRLVTMSYWQVPYDVLEDKEMLGIWLDKAYQISVNATRNKKGRGLLAPFL